ncbi:hypothetical protein [Methylobacter sp.]|uniref:hypothetical protein n=1 Tax=Methylobacter sp. TaxID=2051955 RepID=UPI00120D85DB|nr:hypothetical protein [Methylobacter sp.]TAK64202.1 MAG: hypothetical protein EPO18_04575 [Methylobacter sp.]
MKNSLIQSFSGTLVLLASGIGLALAAPSPNLPTGPGQCVPMSQMLPDGTFRTIYVGHPCPNPRPPMPTQTTVGDTTTVITSPSLFAKKDPFVDPVHATNLLPNFDGNLFDGNGVEMQNTLPSSAEHPYNLHDAPQVSSIDVASPETDLVHIFKLLKQDKDKNKDKDGFITEKRLPGEKGLSSQQLAQRALDILEGNSIPNRVYSGMSVLHYKGPEKVAVVDKNTKNVNIHQIWYGSHIEADAAFIDVSQVKEEPFTITYTVDVLNRGEDDFAPMVMYFDDPALSMPGMPPMPHTSMDTTFFPMIDGKRYIFKIKMPPGKYYNLSYTWGWREHPPRAQVTENAAKKLPNEAGVPRTLVQWEQDVFGMAPTASVENKLAAIAKIGELAPEKRMWQAMRQAIGYANDTATTPGAPASDVEIRALMDEALAAFDDWGHRTRLPRGIVADPDADATLLYINNTMYGQMKGGGRPVLDKWRLRGTNVKITLLNGDHFLHSYLNPDFGGSRGWENQFQSTKDIGGSGCWFTFGRFQWWMNVGGPFGMVNVQPVNGVGLDGIPGMHKVDFTMNYEPSPRLRMYQFDPAHHETAIFSLH